MFFDLIGALASLLSTYFFIRLNNKAWPMGIIATLLNGWLYWYKGIYADMFLEVFYFLSMCYGWYLWKRKKPDTTMPTITLGYLNPFQWLSLGLLLGLLFITIYYLLTTYTQSTVALLDATTTSLSLAAQWLMCHKIIYTWVLWLITDALYASMYLGKDLSFHSILMIVYIGMAVTGYVVWARKGKRASVLVPGEVSL